MPSGPPHTNRVKSPLFAGVSIPFRPLQGANSQETTPTRVREGKTMRIHTHRTAPGVSSGRGLERRQVPRRVSGPASGPKLGVDAATGEDLVEMLVATELSRLLSIASRYSVCSDDAHDACQRAFEILIRRADSLDPLTAAAWLRTVVKNEALAVRAERVRLVTRSEPDLERIAGRARSEDTVEALDRLSVASEALSTIKPREAEALLLQAEGLSYQEIAAANGWSYTKVNRLITEGSKAFRKRVASIDRGSECSEVLSYFASQADKGNAPTPSKAMRLHLARCVACRSEAAGGRPAIPRFALGIPMILALHDRILRAVHASSAWMTERTVYAGTRAQTAIEAASATKLTAVALSAAALASGGAAVGEVRAIADQRDPAAAASTTRSAPKPLVTSDPQQTTKTASPVTPSDQPPAKQPEAQPAPAPAALEFDPMGATETAARTPSPTSSTATSATRQQQTKTISVRQTQLEFGP